MEFRKMGGLNVASVGFGTYISFDVASESEVAVRHEIIDNCITHQVTFLDSSPMYGHAEKIIGITTEGKRDKFQLATKVWCTGRQEGEVQIARSFELMRTDYVDVFQVHNLLDWRTHLPTLERLKGEGKVGLIGISTNSRSAFPEAMDIMRTRRIDAIQVPYNVVNRACESDVLPLALELGIGVIVMEPLQKGRYVSGLSQKPDLSPLAEIGIETWAQALLAWVLGHPAITVVIPATSRPERIAENAVAGSIGQLPEELRDYIRTETERCA